MFLKATGIFDPGKYQLIFSDLFSDTKINTIFDFDAKGNVFLFSY